MADSQRKTANLFDKGSQNWKVGYRIDDEGNEVSSQIAQYSQNRIEVSPSSKYTAFGFYPDGTSLSNSGFKLYCYDANDVWIENISASLNSPKEFTMPDNCHYIRIQVTTAYYTPNTAMINEGSTALPYEPYGWQHSLRKLGTSTDTITTLPADLYADGTNATVGLVGNMYQASGVSPTTPIQPQETGERTGNLFDKSAPDKDITGYIQSDGSIALSQNYYVSGYIDISDLSNVTISGMGTGVNPAYCLYNANKQYVSGNKYNNAETITVNITTEHYIRFSYRVANENTTMLNSGSTAKPFEPYGYKIPILNNSQTTNVYLGEVQSTRQIKKLVLTGQEDVLTLGSPNIFGISNQEPPVESYQAQLCSHYSSQSSWSDIQANNFSFGISSPQNTLVVHDNRYNSTTDFKNYLQQQYTAGTPVTAWYVLATPTTGIVNEPIRKIGTYADEVSGITIPTIAGANAIDVDTTLKPSEVTATYKGWHPVADVHERENGEWD